MITNSPLLFESYM